MIHANPQLDPWNLRPQQRIRLPTETLLPQGPREGIVVNVPEMRLYYFPRDNANVFVYAVAVGRADWETPLGTTQVTAKVRNPVWYPPETIRAEHAAQGDPLPPAVPPGPDNPLGTLALRLGWPLVLIHGTNMPLGGIGMPVTHGCIRLYPQDIETLFEQVPVGTRVTFIDQPYKLGRHRGHWYLEAHAPLAEDPRVLASPDIAPALTKVKARAGDSSQDPALNWDRVAAVLRRSDGTPMSVETPPFTTAPRPTHAPSAAATVRRTALAEAETNPLLLALGLLVILALLTGLVRLLAGLIRRRRGRLHRGNIGTGA